MKKSFLIFLLLCYKACCAQTIDETVNYINMQILESTKSVLKFSYFDQITLTNDGKIIIDTYLPPIKNSILFESRTCYIKQLKYSNIQVIEMPDKQIFNIGLKCIDNTNCIACQIVSSEGDYVGETVISVYNKDIAIKVNNAVKHLFELSMKNANFKEKDPFSN